MLDPAPAETGATSPTDWPTRAMQPPAMQRSARQAAACAGVAENGAGAGQRVAQTLALLQARLAPNRRIVHAGELVYSAGARFTHLYVLNSGMFKIVNLSADGREQVVGLKFRGDWLGLGGIADGRYTCDALAMDTGEIWSFEYRRLLAACASDTALLTVLHEAMSREIAREREALMSVCTLPADARVAEFLRRWAASLERCGMRTDEIALRMTRAEIGNYLGMTLETVSRSLSRLAREGLIAFAQKGRRDVQIADVQALADFVQRCVGPQPALLH